MRSRKRAEVSGRLAGISIARRSCEPSFAVAGGARRRQSEDAIRGARDRVWRAGQILEDLDKTHLIQEDGAEVARGSTARYREQMGVREPRNR